MFQSAERFNAHAGALGEIGLRKSRRSSPSNDLSRQEDARGVDRGVIAAGVRRWQARFPRLANQRTVIGLWKNDETLPIKRDGLNVRAQGLVLIESVSVTDFLHNHGNHSFSFHAELEAVIARPQPKMPGQPAG